MPMNDIRGKIILLRVNDIGYFWGPPNDRISTEVTVVLDNPTPPSQQAFGFNLKEGDPNLPSRLAMLSVLRDAYIHNRQIRIWYEKDDPANNNGIIRKIDLFP